VTEERKFAILFAATILAAQKLIDMDPDKTSMAKQFFVDRAIEDAALILERINARWPTSMDSFAAKDL
jgi:thiamine pyrophosphate-dependent acetolactate synthase large subunit-like protein